MGIINSNQSWNKKELFHLHRKPCNLKHFYYIKGIHPCKGYIYAEHNHLYSHLHNHLHINWFSINFQLCCRKSNSLWMNSSMSNSFSCKADIFTSFDRNIFHQNKCSHMYSIVSKDLKNFNNKMCTLMGLKKDMFNMEKNICLRSSVHLQLIRSDIEHFIIYQMWWFKKNYLFIHQKDSSSL